tara:strand:+ start:1073 stop:1987 length:915 start_codon:yes stop_codon:yes gene_type:complete
MKLDLVWIIYRKNSGIAEQKAKQLIIKLAKRRIKSFSSKSQFDKDPIAEMISSKKQLPNLVIVLGGDGTVLEAVRYIIGHSIPLLSFNVGGNLGFLSNESSILNNDFLWDQIINENYSIEKRMMIEASVKKINSDGFNNIKTFSALNDFYFKSAEDNISPTCNLQLEIDGEIVDEYKGDGLILSSPTGSTAYSMASGGSILHPKIEAIIVSAICPMSLSSRPIVVPGDSKLVISLLDKSQKSIKLWQDGSFATFLNFGEKCVLKKSIHQAHMIKLDETPSYYQTLSHKLHWAGSLKGFNRKNIY